MPSHFTQQPTHSPASVSFSKVLVWGNIKVWVWRYVVISISWQITLSQCRPQVFPSPPKHNLPCQGKYQLSARHIETATIFLLLSCLLSFLHCFLLGKRKRKQIR
ncbi:uncharacterized protein LOC108456291 isoform X2 [Gossypium arboreum]|uniref:uncharacterized protein LOC108456291 isoform X2 n=1 Tax=Gossypium arboreum TaxID=29729 RepID=UPI0022F18BDA|nr:uncharacterized protein LOC108456291 isoform X2 [Gossypium arboreum]